MKILAARSDEIRRERDEFNSKKYKSEKIRDEQVKNYRQAERDIFNPIEEYVESNLSKYSDDVRVEVDTRYGSGIQVQVRVNEDHKFDDDYALAWSFSVWLKDNGQVEKESSSWSGLNATTAASVEDLKKTVSAIEWLSSQDWVSILDKKLPDWEEYVTEKVPTTDRNFNQEIQEAQIEEIVGQRKAIEGVSLYQNALRRNGDGWYIIKGETPKFYTVIWAPEYRLKEFDSLEDMLADEFEHGFSERVKKEKFVNYVGTDIVSF